MGYSFRQNPAISKCSLKIFYGGHWKNEVYTGGNIVWVDDLDSEKANLAALHNIASKLGYQKTQTSYSYRSPTTKKVVNINSDEDVKKMVNELPVSRDLKVFFDGVSEKEEPEEYPSILFWNCRGLGDPAIDLLKVLINIYEPSIIFLIETRLSSKVIKKVSSSLGFRNVWDSAVTKAVADEDNCVGLAMLMKSNMNVTFLDNTSNYLDFVITDSAGERWRLTGFYGHPKLKHLSWKWLRKLSKVERSLPWIIFGDFNEILYKKEKSGGLEKSKRKMKAFKKVKKSCGLHDMPFEGSIFTWKRDNIMQRLDRGLITLKWKDKFPSPRVLHLTAGDISDHIPIVIQTDGGKHKIEDAFALSQTMAPVLEFVQRLEDKYKLFTLGLTTISNILKETKPKSTNDFYFETVKMIAPQVIHATDVAIHDEKAGTVKHERLVTLRTRHNLRFLLWNCMVLPKSSGDDLEALAECPSASCKRIITKEVNLSKHLAQMWKLVLMISTQGKMTQQEIINRTLNEQVDGSIMWLTNLLPQNNDKHFVINKTVSEYENMIEVLEGNAVMVGRAVVLYNIIISLIKGGMMARAGIISELEEKLGEDIKYYIPQDTDVNTKRLYVTEPLQYLLNRLKWQEGAYGYKVDIEAKKLSELEDKRFEAERKALMSKSLLPLVEKIMKKGSVEIEKLKELIRDAYTVKPLKIQEQIDSLIKMEILRVNGNEVELVESDKSGESIVARLEKAADIALKSLKASTSKKPMKYWVYMKKITNAYKKTKALKGA